MSEPTREEMLRDMRTRVMCATGEPPGTLLASRGFGRALMRELDKKGLPMIQTGQPDSVGWVPVKEWKPTDFCFTYMGMTVSCELDTYIPTLLCRI